MQRYRRKPLIFEAIQFFADWEGDGPIDNLPDGVNGDYGYRTPMDAYWWIDTLEGKMSVQEGDWIVTGVNGEHWPVKPDIFAETYEEVIEHCTCWECMA